MSSTLFLEKPHCPLTGQEMWGWGGGRAFDLTCLLNFLEVSVFCEFIGFWKEQFGKTCFSDGENGDGARLLVF